MAVTLANRLPSRRLGALLVRHEVDDGGRLCCQQLDHCQLAVSAQNWHHALMIRPSVRAAVLRLGWAIVHCTVIVAYVLAVSVGTEDRFCTWWDRPMNDAGPFGSDPSFVSWKTSWVGWLLVVGLVGSVALMVVAVGAARVTLLASVTNGLVWLGGVAVIGYLAVAQTSDGLFCTGGSVAAGVAVITVLSGVAALAHRWLEGTARCWR